MGSKTLYCLYSLFSAGILTVSAGAQTPPTYRADIYYDSSHVAHIYGRSIATGQASDPDAFFGLGFQQMMDFPLQTLGALWTNTGSAETALGINARGIDIQVWAADIPAIANAQMNNPGDSTVPVIDTQVKTLLEAYVEGVNEGRKWWRVNANVNNPASTGGTVTYINSLSTATGQTVATLNHLFSVPPATGPLGPDGDMRITLYHVLCNGLRYALNVNNSSNSWLASQTAANGNLILHTDIHTPLIEGSTFRGYFVHIHGSQYQVAGNTIPGWPCITNGINGSLAWALTSANPDPISSNAWSAALTTNPATSQKSVLMSNGVYEDVVHVQANPFVWYDTTGGILQNVQPIDSYFIDRESTSAAARRYPIISTYDSTSTQVTFAQKSGLTSRCWWELYIKLGQASVVTSDTTITNGTAAVFNLDIFPWGQNILVGGSNGSMQYVRMGRTPIQGTGAAGGDYALPTMDGSDPTKRWAGFHTYADEPKAFKTAGATGNEVWINTNVHPKLTTGTPTDITPSSFPSYLLGTDQTSSWRQFRAEELLRNQSANAITIQKSEDAGHDQVDNWARVMLPLFFAAAPQYTPTFSNDAALFLNWLQSGSGQFQTGLQYYGATPEFTADKLSEREVYITLLRGYYERQVQAQSSYYSTDDQTALARLGNDPAYTIAAANDTAHFLKGQPNQVWDHVIDFMNNAIENIGHDYFYNPTVSGLSVTSPKLLNASLGSISYPTSLNPWSSTAGWPVDGTVRWGSANWLVTSTPGFFPPPSKAYDDYLTLTFGIPADYLFYLSYLAATNQNCSNFGVTGVHSNFEILPIGGLTDSLFVITDVSPTIAGYNTYMDGVRAPFPCSYNSKPFYYSPHTFGSRAMFSVRLNPNRPPYAEFLQAFAGTEIQNSTSIMTATSGFPAIPFGPYIPQNTHSLTSPDFVDGNWKKLIIGIPSGNDLKANYTVSGNGI
ncbi:MAG: penicillin acylase family protein [Planctomycetes bacterium]|nr:penicillin acylase family protein [Planctomycetota bacterium]